MPWIEIDALRSLRHASVPLERAPEVTASPGYHGQLVPVRPKESERPGTELASRKNLKASISIQGIICLLDMQENLEEYRLPHGCKMFEQLGIEISSTCTTSRPKPVQHIVENNV